MSTSAEPRERIEELAARIVALRDAYYRGEPLVADADYDPLEDELRDLINSHPTLAPDPNPLESVGAPVALHAPADAVGEPLRPAQESVLDAVRAAAALLAGNPAFPAVLMIGQLRACAIDLLRISGEDRDASVLRVEAALGLSPE